MELTFFKQDNGFWRMVWSVSQDQTLWEALHGMALSIVLFLIEYETKGLMQDLFSIFKFRHEEGSILKSVKPSTMKIWIEKFNLYWEQTEWIHSLDAKSLFIILVKHNCLNHYN
jgi:hypothetical protein